MFERIPRISAARDEMTPAANAIANLLLGCTRIAAPFEGRKHHGLKHTTCSSVPRFHRFLVAKTSLARVRSPVQLIIKAQVVVPRDVTPNVGNR